MCNKLAQTVENPCYETLSSMWLLCTGGSNEVKSWPQITYNNRSSRHARNSMLITTQSFVYQCLHIAMGMRRLLPHLAVLRRSIVLVKLRFMNCELLWKYLIAYTGINVATLAMYINHGSFVDYCFQRLMLMAYWLGKKARYDLFHLGSDFEPTVWAIAALFVLSIKSKPWRTSD